MDTEPEAENSMPALSRTWPHITVPPSPPSARSNDSAGRTWKCSLGRDRSTCTAAAVRFGFSAGLSATAVLVSVVQIGRGEGDQAIWYSLLSSTVALWVPSPAKLLQSPGA